MCPCRREAWLPSCFLRQKGPRPKSSVGATLAVARLTKKIINICRAAPMCAAADHAPHPRRRGTLAPPYRRFINSVGDGVLNVPLAPHPVSRTRRAGGSCCGAQNFGAALRRPLKILTAASRSSRFLCHRQRSIRSPHPAARHPPCPQLCHCEPVTDVTGVAIRPPALRLRWLPFFLRRKKGRKERRQNPWFWNPFRG